MVKLSIQDSEGRTTIVPLQDGTVDIGRSDENAICLTDRTVSRHHAKLTVQGSRVWIENVAATWGTKRNKLLIREKTELADGDLLQVGDYSLEIDNDDAARRDTALLDDSAARTAGKGMDGATAMINLADLQGLQPPTGAATAIPEPSQPRLVVESENLRGLELRISKTPIVLGRVRENADLVLDHRSISKEHARLTRLSGGTWQILDLGSANGLKVNGEPYSKCDIQSGDRIELGHVMLRFLASGVATPALEDVGAPTRSKLPIAIGIAVAAAVAAVIVVVALAGGKKPGEKSNDNNDVAKVAAASAVEPEAERADPAAAKADVAAHEAAEKPEENAATDRVANPIQAALDKADALRKQGAFDDALKVLRATEVTNPNNPQILLAIRRMDDAIKWQADAAKWKSKLDHADALLSKSPAVTLQLAEDAKAHVPADDPLAETAEKLINAAKAEIAAKAEPGLDKHKHASPDIHETPEPKNRAQPEVVKPEPPKPAPQVNPVLEQKPAAKTGKELYEEGRQQQMDGHVDAAIASYNLAIKSGISKAYKNLALLYQGRKDKANCAKNARAYLEKNPSAADAESMQSVLDQCAN